MVYVWVVGVCRVSRVAVCRCDDLYLEPRFRADASPNQSDSSRRRVPPNAPTPPHRRRPAGVPPGPPAPLSRTSRRSHTTHSIMYYVCGTTYYVLLYAIHAVLPIMSYCIVHAL